MKEKSKSVTLESVILLQSFLILSIVIVGGYIDQYLMLPLAIMLVMGIATGFFLDNILLLWLVTILMFVGISIILNLGTQVSSIVKIALLLLFPITSIGSSLIKRMILSRVTIINNRKLIVSKLAKKNLITKMGTEKSFEKYYAKIINIFADQERLVVITLITLPYYEQRTYTDQSQLFKKLSEIATALKCQRLPSERLFYIGKGEFIIVSLRIAEKDVETLNMQTREQLKKIYFEVNNEKHELRYQFASVRLIPEKPLPVDELIKKLHRKQETDLIDEYLL